MGEGTHSKIKVAIIGAGNVATHLARTISDKAEIIQIFSRNILNANILADELNITHRTDSVANIATDADVYIVSLKDDALEGIIATMPKNCNNALWLHTSGSKSIDVFNNKVENFGVLYPLQTFSKDVAVTMNEVPFFIEGNNEYALTRIKEIASLFSPYIYEATSETRRQMHIAAVFACNFANQLWAISSDILKEANLPFSVLLPLIKATVAKIEKVTPIEAQTGPAARGDTNIISNHLSSLNGERKEIYSLLSDSILKYHNERN